MRYPCLKIMSVFHITLISRASLEDMKNGQSFETSSPKIATNSSFTNGDRIYYLKTNVEGEAADLIQDYNVEGDSFTRA